MKKIQDVVRNPDTHPVLESHMLKIPQTIAGLALLFEIILKNAVESTTSAYCVF